jgi:hypothetical protein
MTIDWYSRWGWGVLALLLLMAGLVILVIHYLALVLVAPAFRQLAMTPVLNFIVNSNWALLIAVLLLMFSGAIFLRND